MKGLLAQHLDEAVDKQVTVIAEQLLVNRAIPERAATDASHERCSISGEFLRAQRG